MPWWELIVRALIIYVLLIGLLRISGKRQIGQLAPFDLVLLLVLSNAVQNAMNGGDNSVLAGIISAVSLIGFNFLAGYLTYRSKRLERLVEGQPEVIIHNGKLFEKVMARAQLTHHELNAALRHPNETLKALWTDHFLVRAGGEPECAVGIVFSAHFFDDS